MMLRMLAFPFIYKEKEYSALVRIKENGRYPLLRVTIMHGELEKKLMGNNIFKYSGAGVLPEVMAEDKDAASLQMIMAGRIADSLHENSDLLGVRDRSATSS